MSFQCKSYKIINKKIVSFINLSIDRKGFMNDFMIALAKCSNSNQAVLKKKFFKCNGGLLFSTLIFPDYQEMPVHAQLRTAATTSF